MERNGGQAFPVLILKIQNDGTGTEAVGNYNCEVLVTVSSTKLESLARARVTGHRRKDGWRKLVRAVVRESVDIECWQEPAVGQAPR